MKEGFLVLEDGSIYKGTVFGSGECAEGEVVFNTGMTGYQEVVTDPSYAGQIVVMTYPQIGNYGFIREDAESARVWVRGFVVRELCDFPGNFRSGSNLERYLCRQGILGIQGVDTRAITRKLRTHGTMRGYLTTEPGPRELSRERALGVKEIGERDLVAEVSSRQEYRLEGSGLHIGIWDFGAKQNIARILHRMGHGVTMLPAGLPGKELLKRRFDLLLLSNGPGDPKSAGYVIRELKELIGKLPLAGICLGHQLLALALGCDTYKLKFGHRGANHPVKELQSGRVYITTQNHGYAVKRESLPEGVEITHINLNDNTVEGLKAQAKRVFSVQFHPEAAPGPEDYQGLFQDFLKLTE